MKKDLDGLRALPLRTARQIDPATLIAVQQPGGSQAGRVSLYVAIDRWWEQAILSGIASGAAGNVVGPATSTDNALARWDGTTGKLLQDSGATLTDGGTLTATTIVGANVTSGVDPGHTHTSASVTLDHGGLTGLSDDDHAQYLLLAGRSSGQVAAGGTATRENLTLYPTSVSTTAGRAGATSGATAGEKIRFGYKEAGTEKINAFLELWPETKTAGGVTSRFVLNSPGGSGFVALGPYVLDVVADRQVAGNVHDMARLGVRNNYNDVELNAGAIDGTEVCLCLTLDSSPHSFETNQTNVGKLSSRWVDIAEARSTTYLWCRQNATASTETGEEARTLAACSYGTIDAADYRFGLGLVYEQNSVTPINAAEVLVQMTDTTIGSEDSVIEFKTLVAGTSTLHATLGAGALTLAGTDIVDAGDITPVAGFPSIGAALDPFGAVYAKALAAYADGGAVLVLGAADGVTKAYLQYDNATNKLTVGTGSSADMEWSASGTLNIIGTVTCYSPTFKNPASPTKQFKFSGSGITAGVTRTITLQDADGTMAYTSDIPSVPITAVSSPLELSGTTARINASAADKFLYSTGADAWAEGDVSSFARTLLDDANAATARATLGLAIGTDVQAYDADLAALAGLTSAANKVPYFTGSATAAMLDFKDEDDMASDSASAVPSQQSVRAYVDGERTVKAKKLNLPRLDISASITLAATNNDVATGGYSNLYITKGVGAVTTITGFSGGADGDILHVFWNSLSSLTFANNNVGSAAGNRILTCTGADIAGAGAMSASFLYDSGAAGGAGAWVVFGYVA